MGIQTPGWLSSGYGNAHLVGDQTPTGEVSWKRFQLFSHSKCANLTCAISHITYIYDVFSNGFNMACYTHILPSMKESFIVKCSFLCSFICKRFYFRALKLSPGGRLRRRTAVSLALCEGVSAEHSSNMLQPAWLPDHFNQTFLLLSYNALTSYYWILYIFCYPIIQILIFVTLFK